MEFQVVIPEGMLAHYERAIGSSHIRSALYAMNGVARDAQRDLKAMLPKIIDKPNPTPCGRSSYRRPQPRHYVG